MGRQRSSRRRDSATLTGHDRRPVRHTAPRAPFARGEGRRLCSRRCSRAARVAAFAPGSPTASCHASLLYLPMLRGTRRALHASKKSSRPCDASETAAPIRCRVRAKVQHRLSSLRQNPDRNKQGKPSQARSRVARGQRGRTRMQLLVARTCVNEDVSVWTMARGAESGDDSCTEGRAT